MHGTIPHTFMGMAAEPAPGMGDTIAGALACGDWAGAPPSVAAAQGTVTSGTRSAEQRAANPSRPCMPRRGRGGDQPLGGTRCLPRGQVVGGFPRLGGELGPAGGFLHGDRPGRGLDAGARLGAS
eukprot:1095251-Prymnesium_polylepis.1